MSLYAQHQWHFNLSFIEIVIFEYIYIVTFISPIGIASDTYRRDKIPAKESNDEGDLRKSAKSAGNMNGAAQAASSVGKTRFELVKP